MTKRYTLLAVRVGMLIALISATALAGETRETPLVRAIRRAKASVINIHSEKTTYSNSDALFNSGKGRKVNGMGTGVVIDERGYIVTNHHVVDGVDSLRVTLHDGATYTARVVSFDRKKDLAIIKIEASKPLPVLKVGTSSDLMLGETVIAVGNAFGYEHTVTSGIISSLSRDVEVNEKQSYKNLIQTDASINPGNSGGPLLNLDGDVVGINVAIRAGAQRIGFAIPIDDARRVIARLISVEQIDHHYHGLKAIDRKSGTSRRYVVTACETNSPADKAGLKSGDVVVRANGIEVVDGVDFERALLGRPAGESLDIVVKRNDVLQTVKLALDKAKTGTFASNSDTTVIRANDDGSADKIWQVLGLKLVKADEGEPALQGSRYRGGLRVTEVRTGSPADSNGIRSGDLLVGLHVWETVNAENVMYVLDNPQLPTFSPLKFYVVRGKETLFGHLRLSGND